MEYVEGHTVYEHMVKEGPYSEKEALAIGLQIAHALDHAHQAGLIHRDVKPKNILITAEGLAKLADMGLARDVSDREVAEAEVGKACGTPYYIAPEQIRGHVDVDFRTDIYSFGATLYHMVTGRVPFEGSEINVILRKHLKDPLLPPDHIRPELSDGFCEIVELCMKKKPDRRYATTDDLIADLQAVADGGPPLHARQLLDVGDLTALGQGTIVEEHETDDITADERSLFVTPLFWIAVTGWILALFLLMVITVIYSH